MSTTTPTTTETEVEPTDAHRWVDSSTAPEETGRRASAAAPLTFDPFCTRRLRNCIDEENAALPGTR